jgi:peptidoglycan/LPS O-acetylase OafA/YrhL
VTASAALDGGPAARTEHAFPGLDGARALAAGAVLVHHVAFWTGEYTPDLAGRALARLDVGVPVFFVLSGFLLSRPLFLAGARGLPRPRTAAYLWRRALRILPAYWLTVAAALLLLPRNGDAGPGTWLSHLALGQVYGTDRIADGLSHTWSLCVEVAFYLVLPVAAGALLRLPHRRPGRPGAVLAALGATVPLALAWIVAAAVWQPFPGVRPDLWLPAYAGWFAAGMALALLSVSDPGWRPVRLARELGGSLPTCWAAAAVLFWMATSSVAGPWDLTAPTPGQAAVKNVLYLGIAALVVLPLVFGDQRAGRVRQVMATPAVRFLGEISYGVFLVHVVVLTGGYAALGWATFQGNLVLVLLVTATVSVALAAGVYLLVERPLRRWRGLVRDTPRGPVTTDAASAPSATSASV